MHAVYCSQLYCDTTVEKNKTTNGSPNDSMPKPHHQETLIDGLEQAQTSVYFESSLSDSTVQPGLGKTGTDKSTSYN